MRVKHVAVAVACASLALAACAPPSARQARVTYPDLGRFGRQVTTSSPDAQLAFDQGLTLYYAFNHEEAARRFREAAGLDPECAMAPWGEALASGPNINDPQMDEAAVASATSAIRRARALVSKASPVERALIDALSARYASPPPEDRRALDEAYAAAMRVAWRAWPTDPDVGALFAESLMDLRPWDLWTPDGKPRPETPEVLVALEDVLALAPGHPGALHFTIHTLEASPFPERAQGAADLLRQLVPDAGHLVHMPSHIDIRLGHYDKAITANLQAISADLRFVERRGRKGFYNLYRAHNYHFLAYAAMFDGRRALALEAARELVREMPVEEVLSNPDVLEGFLAVPIHVMVRFGLWDALLAEPRPPADFPVTTAFWHYGRSVALSALGRVDAAENEFAALRRAAAAVPESAYVGNNTARVLLDIALPMAEGELEYRRGNHDAGVRAAARGGQARRRAALRRAVGLDAAGPPRPRRTAGRTGQGRRGRGGLPRGPASPPEQRVVAPGPRGVPAQERAGRRGGRGRSPLPGRVGPRRHHCSRLLLLPPRRLTEPVVPTQRPRGA